VDPAKAGDVRCSQGQSTRFGISLERMKDSPFSHSM
jgi:hypothetical protein